MFAYTGGLKGDTGDAGAQGIQGVQGDAGIQGEQGIQGIQGIQGEQGASGSLDFTDAGDLAAFDYTHGDFTINGQWHDLDISGKVGVAERLVLIEFRFEASALGRYVRFRTKGFTNGFNEIYREVIVVNTEHCYEFLLLTDASGVIEYKFMNALYVSADMNIRSWIAV